MEQREGEWEKREGKERKGWEMKGMERTNKGRENQRLSLHTTQDTKEDKSHPFSVPIPEFLLKLGVGNLSFLSFLLPHFPQIPQFLAWFTWAICVLLASPSAIYQSWLPSSVLPQPSSSTNFP